MQKIFLGTQNEGKIERITRLLKHTGLDVQCYTPKDFGLENIIVEENGTSLSENARLKAQAYFGTLDLPILAIDSGFWVAGEGLVQTPKRVSLGDKAEHELSLEERASAMVNFWKDIARKHGGNVDAAWIDAMALLRPDGQIKEVEARRDVILTDTEFGTVHLQLPIRALYISKITNKPVARHTPEEDLVEFQPITDALKRLLSDIDFTS